MRYTLGQATTQAALSLRGGQAVTVAQPKPRLQLYPASATSPLLRRSATNNNGHDFSLIAAYQLLPINAPQNPVFQRAVADGAVESAVVPSPLIVDDDAVQVELGQMRKSDFLAELQSALLDEDPVVASSEGADASRYYADQDSQELEADIRRYAPGATNAIQAGDYIPVIVERLRTLQAGGAKAAASNESTAPAEPLLAKARTGAVPAAATPAAILQRLGAGHPLHNGLRSQLEPAFGYDFSQVRIHTDTTAAGLATNLNARAFTIGRDVAFGAGEYRPGTLLGDALIAHELAHVVQQSGTNATVAPIQVGDAGYNRLEADADRSAAGVMAKIWGRATGALKEIAQNAGPRLRSGLSLQRCPTERETPQNEAPATPAPPAPPAPAEPAPPEPAAPTPAAPTTNCTSTTDADKVIVDHRVDPTVIEKPGDSVTFTVTFGCKVRYGGYSQFLAPDGSTFSPTTFPNGTGQYTRPWDGKKQFARVGTFTVDDGTYYHQLDRVKYAVRGSTDLLATGSKLKSPPVTVRVRGHSGSGANHFHYTTANVDALAAIIQSESGVGNSTEQRAIAWSVRNQMNRLNTGDVTRARDHFNDAHDQAATAGTRTIAEEVLKKPMADDVTSGAIKWFSPRSMPKAGGSCRGYDCSGGLIEVTDDAGKKVKVYAPGFHKSMSYVAVSGVREWYLRLYKL